MSAEVEEKLNKIPIVRNVVKLLQLIKLPGFGGFSLYDLLETYTLGIIKGTFSSRASSIAYSFFMAIFPFLLFILNVIPYIRIENFQARFLIFIQELLPPQTQDFFYPVIEDIALNPRSSLLSVTFFLTMFLTANGVNAIFSAFEYSFYVTINRGFFRQYFISFLVSIFLAVIILITVGAILYGEYFINFLTADEYIQNEIFWINVLQFGLFALMLYIVVATLYHFGVKEGRETSFFSIGALVTTLLFVLTTYFFGVYINNFSQYNELYGSIGALLIMMVYIWINSNLLLLGFELNISLQRLKEKCI
ncbi:YihY/virulence factor BrkB family protein [Aureisphaera sp. CAU 1614]|uniref:YihY/virulence factor BrkB family protein n=1 Tax=Halomarinibacterium sedimenti TaxID=2857106 RepID=A0A9X1FQM3_9FLAO|nr:YihY/virulence factor BrkB family protein [Halomarinibacterium sedimenti]MAL60054.1 ribonuclease BN [Flavobacteriaceae bacterium]MBW2938052.1 YihY/virulence factor BrkB family protein [Halomarinibacterium sedimenti]HAT67894.1 ribonuclease BN [Flavobacteriaceae bacterium]|tara:strand:- start:224101 stop:225021 length:921 start_codon:yes stop_codon:yes gene_type:complete